MLHLQGTVGNQAAQNLVAERRLPVGGAHAPGKLLLRQPDGSKQAQEESRTGSPKVDEVWQSLLNFSSRATPAVVGAARRMNTYLSVYDSAYATFAKTLEQAKKDVEKQAKWADLVMGIVIGTGVGLAAGSLYEATSLVGKIVYEATGEGVEAGAAGLMGLGAPANPDFKPPDDLNNDKIARGYYEKFMQAALSIMVMQNAALVFTRHRDTLISKAAGGKGDKTPQAKIMAEIEGLEKAVNQADQALKLFLTTADTPILDRDQTTVEQDIWISWMGRSNENANAVLGDGPIAQRLGELHIWTRYLTEGGGLNDSSKEAQEEDQRIHQIGKVGVVIVPPTYRQNQRNPERMGVIRFRHDGYAAAGRADPDPSGSEEYAKINYAPDQYIEPGEVVMASSTKPPALNIQRLGPTLAVSKEEREAGYKVLGISAAEYVPEMADALTNIVFSAENVLYQEEAYHYSIEDRPPPFKKTLSEDGILLSGANGKKLILFTVRTNNDLVAALLRKDKTGAAMVVAVNLDPKEKIDEFEMTSALITNHTDAAFLAEVMRPFRQQEIQAVKQ